jgi:hypothetical protein
MRLLPNGKVVQVELRVHPSVWCPPVLQQKQEAEAKRRDKGEGEQCTKQLQREQAADSTAKAVASPKGTGTGLSYESARFHCGRALSAEWLELQLVNKQLHTLHSAFKQQSASRFFFDTPRFNGTLHDAVLATEEPPGWLASYA